MEGPGRDCIVRVIIGINGPVRQQRLVEDQGHHAWSNTGRRGGIHRVGRRQQRIVTAEFVGVDSRDLIAGPILNRNGQEGWSNFFAIVGAGHVELGAQIIVDKTDRASRLGNCGEFPEADVCVLATGHVDLLAVAQRTAFASIRCSDAGEESQLSRDSVKVTDANRRQAQGTRSPGFTEIDVLVLFFHQDIAGRHCRLDDVGTSIQAADGITAIEHSRANLVPGAEGIGTFSDNRIVNGRQILNTTGRLVVVPAVGPGNAGGDTPVKAAVAVTVHVLGAGEDGAGKVFAPAEGMVVDVGQDAGGIDHAVGVEVSINVDLHPRDARLPFFAGSVTRIVLGAGYCVEDDPGDAAVFIIQGPMNTVEARAVRSLAPVDDIALAEEQVHGLQQGLAGRSTHLGA